MLENFSTVIFLMFSEKYTKLKFETKPILFDSQTFWSHRINQSEIFELINMILSTNYGIPELRKNNYIVYKKKKNNNNS